jgi:carboxymethylenebutenolidase
MRQLQPFETYLIHEFVEDYEDGLMSRRDMIRRVLHITGGVAATATILTSLGVTPMTRAAYAQETTPVANGPQSPLSVAADDPRIVGEDISFEGNGATIMAYTARPASGATPEAGTGSKASPAAGGALPVVLICHENRGLTEHIRDVTRRWAVEGYMGVAVDLLSRNGGTDAISDPNEIGGLLTRDVDPARHVGDFQATIEYLRGNPSADMDRLAMTGFCFGGGITWRAATAIPELTAAAPYYGPPPPLDQVPNIKAAVLGVYSDDPGDFANEGRDDLVAALEAAGVVHEIKVYPNTQHAFNNDTGPRYNPEAALAAWQDTVAWFAEHV